MMLLPISGWCQVEINHQPQASWFADTWKMHAEKQIPKDELLTLKRTFNVPGFQDTLRKYDWISLGGYLHADKAFTTSYNEQAPSYQITRLDEADTVLYFSYNASYAAMDAGTIAHTNFAVTMGMHPVWKVVQLNSKWFIKDVNNNEYLHLISYSNGVLVYDIPMNGKATDTKMFSRQVLMARPRAFEWSKTSN